MVLRGRMLLGGWRVTWSRFPASERRSSPVLISLVILAIGYSMHQLRARPASRADLDGKRSCHRATRTVISGAAGGAVVGDAGEPIVEVSPPSPHAHGWFVHFHTSLLLGLLAVVLFGFLHTLPGIAALNRLGQDLAQSVYAGASHPIPDKVTPVVLLGLDFAGTEPERSELGDVTEAITRLALLKPNAIVVDQEIAATVASDKLQDFIAAIKQALAQKIQVVVLPAMIPGVGGRPATMLRSPLDPLRGLDRVRFAVPVFFPDPDEIIRSTPSSVCVTWPDGTSDSLPTLGRSIDTLSRSSNGATALDCAAPELLEILYTVGQPNKVAQPISQNCASPLPWISLNDLGSDNDDIARNVRGKVVLIGDIGPGDWRDMHPTPVGMMVGALVHANILLTPPDHTIETEQYWWSGGLLALVATSVAAICFTMHYRLQSRLPQHMQRWWLKGLVGVLLFIMFAALSITAAWQAVLCSSLLISAQHSRTEAVKLAMEVSDVVFIASLFATYFVVMDSLRPKRRAWDFFAACLRPVLFAVSAALAIFYVGGTWVFFGSKMLPVGLKVGSLVPAFTAGLEALIKAGRDVIGILEAGVKRVMTWVAAVGLVLAIQAGWSANALAEPGGLLVMSVGKGQVEHETTTMELTPNQPTEVAAGDLVVLEAGAVAEIQRSGAESLSMKGPGNFWVLPIPREHMTSDLGRSFVAFYELLFSVRPRPGPQVGATVRLRGGSKLLRWATLLPAHSAELPPGPGGLALYWSGGRSPYTVTIEGEQTGQGFAFWTSDHTLMWAPGFVMPDEPIKVVVRDSDGASLSADVLPATSPVPCPASSTEAADAPATVAMALFAQADPKWRLEAVRRLAALASTNPQADSALVEIQLAPRSESPP